MKKCAGPDGPACDENSSWNANRGQCMPSEKADPVYKKCGLFGLFKTEADLSTACPGGYVYCDQGTMWDAPSAQCILDADASACSATQYRDASGQCISYSPECSSNQYESVKPTAERDRECQNCSLCDPTTSTSRKAAPAIATANAVSTARAMGLMNSSTP